MLSICGKDCCEKCSRKESCGGCIKVKGHPFGGQCVAANWVQNFGREGMEERKQALIQEINALSIPDLCSTASRLPVALRSSASAKLYQKWSKTPELRGFRGFSFSNGLTQFDRTKPLLTRFLWVKWWTTTPKRGLMG